MNLPDFQLPVPANPPDAGTAYYCEFGQDWLPAVLTVLEHLRDELVWLTPPSDIIPQVDELIARIQTAVIVAPQLFAIENYHLHSDSVVIHGNALAWVSDANQMFGGGWAQTASAIDDEFIFQMTLPAGIAKMVFMARKASASGIMTITTDEGHSYTVDLYNATTQNNQRLSVNVQIDAEGVHQFNVKMHTKNASSTGYGCVLDYIMR